ncbi:MAG: TMEM175 family protein [Ginsengibacter sp.]
MNTDKHKLSMASGRLEALGDGIFAVAMTILAIELHLPEKMKGNSWNDFVLSLHDSWQSLLCYVISFVVLGIMWFGHRMMFEYIGKTDRFFIFLGVLFYLVVCLVPFSTRILAANTLKWYAIIIYALNLSLCNLTLYFQWIYGIKKASLLHREIPAEVRREASVLFLLSPIVYAIASAISPFFPQISIAIFIITPVVYLLPNKLDKYLP